MSSINFPTLPSASLPDSSQFSVSLEDPAMRVEMEGGYSVTRARFTRAPRKTWTISYQMLTDADRAVLDTFWSTVRGGSAIFNWTSPQNATSYKVRFKGVMKFTYVGIKNQQRWNCSFELEQA